MGKHLHLQESMDHHKKDHSAVPISDGTVHGAKGQAKPKVVTTRGGWSLLEVQWKDGSISWEKLEDLKMPSLTPGSLKSQPL
jgi:hypothetical protein